MQASHITPKTEEMLRRNTIPWYSNLVKTDERNTYIAASDLMKMRLKFKWGDLQPMPGHQPRKKKPKPKVTRTKPPGKFSKKARKAIEDMKPKKGLSAAFKILRDKEKQDRADED